MADSDNTQQKKDEENIQQPVESEETGVSGEAETLKKENEELLVQLKRAVADYRNLEARVEKDRSAFIGYFQSDIVKKFLPVLDNLEKASTALNDEGVSMITDQFKKVLEGFGVSVMDVLGKEFDPQFHECINLGEGKENMILEVLENGYMVHDKVLRPAKVRVGKEHMKSEEKKTSQESESNAQS